MIPKNACTDAKCVCGSDTVDSNGLNKILEKHGKDPSAVLAILGDIQSKYKCLPADALRVVAETTGCSLVDVYATATFYRSFSLEPKGKHVISICMGTACHVRGAPAIVEEFERQLGIKSGETTPDGEFSLESPHHLGVCALGPIVVVDGRYFSKVTTAQVAEIIEKVRADGDDDQDTRCFRVDVNCPICNHSLMAAGDSSQGHASIVVTADNGVKGCLKLSSIYPRNTAQAEHDVALDTIVDVLCPYCQSSMCGSFLCPECEAPMVKFAVRGGGILYICSRWGCGGHLLDLASPEKSI